MLFWNNDLVSLILLDFQAKKNFSHPNKTTTCWAVVYTEQGTSNFYSQLLAMAVGCVNQANAAPDEKHDALPLSIQLSVLEDCYVTMLDIAMLDVTSTHSHYRESDRHGAPSCVVWPVKTMWPLGNFVLQCWAETVYCRCDGNRDDSTISDQNWIKNREAAASRFTLRQGLTGKWTSEWMNQSLVFCSLPLCHFLILSFQVVCFWEKILQHDFACCLSMLPLKFQGTWMVPSSYPFLPKQTSEKNSDRIPIFCTSSWNLFEYLCQSTQRRISCNTFFCKAYVPFGAPFGAQQWKFPSSYRSLSLFYTRCAPFRAWKCSQARPAALQYYGSPLSAVSSTCKEITWDKCYAMEVCALPCSLQAWLRNV